jgi:ribosomal protein L6P/L9E
MLQTVRRPYRTDLKIQGQVAADIRRFNPLEPITGNGVGLMGERGW